MEKEIVVAVVTLLNVGSAFATGNVMFVAQLSSSFKILEMRIFWVYEALPAGSLCQATPTLRCLSSQHCFSSSFHSS